MKTVSIKQPYASLVVEGIKNIENRSWKTNFRGRVLVHSSAKMVNNLRNDSCFSHLFSEEQRAAIYGTWEVKDMWANILPFSSIIGSVEIVDCVVNHPSIWAEKTFCTHPEDCKDSNQRRCINGCIYCAKVYNWVLANPVKYNYPLQNIKGKLSLWDFPCVPLKNGEII